MTWIPGDVSGLQQMTDLDHLYVGHINELRSAFNNLYIFNVKNYGAIGDGITDDTVAINNAETELSILGGTLYFPAGTYMTTGVTKKSNTIWKGDGWGVSTIKLIDNTTVNAVIQGEDAYILYGTDSTDGIVDFAIRDMTIDGNRTGGGTSDGIGIYGWCHEIANVEIKSCGGNGLVTEYGIPAIEKHQNIQSQYHDILIWDNDGSGVIDRGPNDSSFRNLNIYWNLGYGIWQSSRGNGKFLHCHIWSDAIGGRQHSSGWRVDTNGNMVTDCVCEGSTYNQLWLRGSSNSFIGGTIYYNQSLSGTNSVAGIVIGDSGISSSHNRIQTTINNCQNGAINYINDGGYNIIDIIGTDYNIAGAGWIGTAGSHNKTRILISGAGTNTFINTDDNP